MPNKRVWVDLGSDVHWAKHGGVWGRPRKGSETEWSVVRFDGASEEHLGTNEGHKYHAACFIVDVEEAKSLPAEGCSARSCIGASDEEWSNPACRAYALAMFGEGREDDVSGNNAHAVLRIAKRAVS